MTGHKGIRNILLAGASALCFVSPTAFAAENIVKIGAVAEVQAVHYANNGAPSQKELSTHQKKYGFSSSGNFVVNYQLVADNGIKYGTKIGIEGSVSILQVRSLECNIFNHSTNDFIM